MPHFSQDDALHAERAITLDRMRLAEERQQFEALKETNSKALADARDEVARLTRALDNLGKRGTITQAEVQLADHEAGSYKRMVRSYLLGAGAARSAWCIRSRTSHNRMT